jgi:hypothetical protein
VRSVKPQLEILEDRLVPALYLWVAAADANFSAANVWRSLAGTGGKPGATDTAQFGGTVNINGTNYTGANTNCTIQDSDLPGTGNFVGAMRITGSYDHTVNFSSSMHGASLGTLSMDSTGPGKVDQSGGQSIFLTSTTTASTWVEGTVGVTSNTANVYIDDGAKLTIDTNNNTFYTQDTLVATGTNSLILLGNSTTSKL